MKPGLNLSISGKLGLLNKNQKSSTTLLSCWLMCCCKGRCLVHVLHQPGAVEVASGDSVTVVATDLAATDYTVVAARPLWRDLFSASSCKLQFTECQKLCGECLLTWIDCFFLNSWLTYEITFCWQLHCKPFSLWQNLLCMFRFYSNVISTFEVVLDNGLKTIITFDNMLLNCFVYLLSNSWVIHTMLARYRQLCYIYIFV